MPKSASPFNLSAIELIEIAVSRMVEVGANGDPDPVAFQCMSGMVRVTHDLVCKKPQKKKTETEILDENLAQLNEVCASGAPISASELLDIIKRAKADRAAAQATDAKVELPEDKGLEAAYIAALRAHDDNTAHTLLPPLLAKHHVDKPSREVAKSRATLEYIEKFRLAVVDMITIAVTRAVGDAPAHDVTAALTMAISAAYNPTIKAKRPVKKVPASGDAKRDAGAASHDSDDDDDTPLAKRAAGKKRVPPPQNQLDQAGMLSDSDDE